MNFEDITKNCTEIKLKSQLVNKTLAINCIKPIKTRFNDSYLCYNKKYNKVFYANAQLRGYIKRLIGDLKSNNNFYYKDDELSDILKFKIESINNEKVNLSIIYKKCLFKDEVLELSDNE